MEYANGVVVEGDIQRYSSHGVAEMEYAPFRNSFNNGMPHGQARGIRYTRNMDEVYAYALIGFGKIHIRSVRKCS
jgi:hypothetical protein